jgi:hypothetical protein
MQTSVRRPQAPLFQNVGCRFIVRKGSSLCSPIGPSTRNELKGGLQCPTQNEVTGGFTLYVPQ